MTMTMTWWQQLRSRFGRRLPPEIRTVVDGVDMKVTEWTRSQAAYNMRHDRTKRDEVERMLIAQYGDKEIGRAEMRRRYPESFYDE